MRIINSSAEAVSPAISHTPNRSGLDELHSHPIRSLFTQNVLDAPHGSLTLKLHWRHPGPEASAAVQALLGGAVDYAARLAAKPFLGCCHLAEWELRSYRPFCANALLVTVQIVAVHREFVIYHCDIHAIEKGRNVAVADSQGTLLQGIDI